MALTLPSTRRLRMRGLAFTPGHSMQLLECGVQFFPALIGAIDAARQSVHLETYIFHFEGDGERVAHALERAARRGIAVRLVMDGIGTPDVPEVWARRWDRAGVQWVRFAPPGRWGLLLRRHWRRLHRKLCVVDERLGYCGGINVLDDHCDPNHGPQTDPRLDYAVRVTGPLVADMHRTVTHFWAQLQAVQALERLQLRQASQWLRPASAGGVPIHADIAAAGAQGTAAGAVGVHDDVSAALVLRDNVRNRRSIERSYLQAVGAARQEIIIANAYFLPGIRLQRALVLAARRGVRVRLLLQGRYEYFLQYHGTRPVLGALLKAGIEIHIVSAAFLHAKVAVVDGHWATIGSSNLEPLSLLLAHEANVVIDHTGLAGDLLERLNIQWNNQGVKLDAAAFARIPVLERTLDGFAYGLMRAALWLTGWRY